MATSSHELYESYYDTATLGNLLEQPCLLLEQQDCDWRMYYTGRMRNSRQISSAFNKYFLSFLFNACSVRVTSKWNYR